MSTPAELRSAVTDLLGIARTDEQATRALLLRVGGAGPEQLLDAALTVAHEQSREIEALERDLETAEIERSYLAQEVEDLRERHKKLKELIA